jgi:hypothetical protein
MKGEHFYKHFFKEMGGFGVGVLITYFWLHPSSTTEIQDFLLKVLQEFLLVVGIVLLHTASIIYHEVNEDMRAIKTLFTTMGDGLEKLNNKTDNRFIPIPQKLDEAHLTESVNKIAASTWNILDLIAKKENKEVHTKLYNFVLERFVCNIEEIEIPVSSIEDKQITDLLDEFANRSEVIIATCCTPMDSFWYVKGVGSTFFKMNMSYASKCHVKRFFLVDSIHWSEKEIKKRELIRLMKRNGIECHIRTQSDLENREKKDHFIFYKKKDDKNNPSEPQMALEWILDTDGKPSKITIICDIHKLRQIDRDYNSVWKNPKIDHALPFDDEELQYLPNTPEGCVKYIENLNKDVLNENSYSYLKNSSNAHLSDKRISDYWQGLKGTIVRPSVAFSESLKQRLNGYTQSGKIENVKIGILGFTPEVVNAIENTFSKSKVYFIDLSSEMHKGMLKLYNDEYKRKPDHNSYKHIPFNWLSLDLIPINFELDLVIGVDVLNMIDNKKDNYGMFLKGIKHITTKDSAIFLQTLCHQNDLTHEPINEFPKKYYDIILSNPDKKNRVYDELFIKYSVAKTNLPSFSQRLENSILLNLPSTLSTIKDSFINYDVTYENVITHVETEEIRTLEIKKGFISHIEKTYELCNSHLNVFHFDGRSITHLEDILDDIGLDINILQVNDKDNFSTQNMYFVDLKHDSSNRF